MIFLRFFPNRVYSIGFSWCIKEEDTQKHTQIVTGNRRRPENSAKALFKNRRVFPSKSLVCYCFIRSENCSLEKQMVFSLFCISLKKRQGFSSKVQLGQQKTSKKPQIIRILDFKMLKTFILDTFAGENAIKPMYFHVFAFLILVLENDNYCF